MHKKVNYHIIYETSPCQGILCILIYSSSGAFEEQCNRKPNNRLCRSVNCVNFKVDTLISSFTMVTTMMMNVVSASLLKMKGS